MNKGFSLRIFGGNITLPSLFGRTKKAVIFLFFLKLDVYFFLCPCQGQENFK